MKIVTNPLAAILLLIPTFAWNYHTNFFEDKYLNSGSITPLVQTGLTIIISVILSYSLYKRFEEPISISKWSKLFAIVPLVLLLGIILIQALIFDSIREDHYNNSGIGTEAKMLNYKYYEFEHDGAIYHGQLFGGLKKLKKYNFIDGEIIDIRFSSSNPLINEPIKPIKRKSG